MGCVTSKPLDPEFLKSKSTKKTVTALLEHANDWKSQWGEFVDALEKTQLNAAHWAQVH
jgi:hypothetical protein